MSESPCDFATLLTQARGGDQAALELLVRQYEPKLRLVARVLLGPALRPYLDSIDLVQSVHRSLLMGLRNQRFTFEKPDDLLALALKLSRRKAARQWRRLQRQQRLSGDVNATTDIVELLASLGQPHNEPARIAQSRDQIARLYQSLNDDERHLLQLRIEGYEPTEIADKLQLSAVAFRVRLTRLRQRLQSAGVFDDWL
jgi:RNA polymerase sigma-70 factor (ECF subfamily)